MPTVGDRAPKRGTGVRIRTKRISRIDREYMITPNALLRGEGMYSVLSSYARLLLAAGLSCGDHETSLEEIDGWIPELGRNRGQAVRRELREHGFMRMYRDVIPAGQPDAGSFIWTYEFLMEQLPVDQRDELQPKKAPKKKAPKQASGNDTAGQTMPRNPGHGGSIEHLDETAGRTMPRLPGHGEPGHGDDGHRSRGDVYKEERTVLKEPPSPPIDVPTEPESATTAAADDPEFEEQVTACIEWVAADRPEWSKRRITGAVRAALADRRDPQIVLAAMRLVAADPQTRVPGRLNEEGDWWARAARQVHRVAAPEVRLVPCDRCGLKAPEGVGCPRCTDDALNGAPGASEGAGGATEIDPKALAMLPAPVRERLAGGVRS